MNDGVGELSADMAANTRDVAASLKELLGQRQQTAPSDVAELGGGCTNQWAGCRKLTAGNTWQEEGRGPCVS